MGAESRRLYVGNLFPEVTDEDIKKRFSKFGSVTKVEIKSKRDIDGEVTETFAFIDLGSGDRGLADCIAGLNNTKWKGKVMKLQQAKESFMERLARERRERESGGGPGGGDGQVQAAPAPQVVKPLAANQERGLDGGRLAGGKLRKRDFTEEQEDFKGFNIKKKTSTDNKYDPMGIFKAKLAGDDEIGRVEGCEEKGEGDGEVKDGMVIFGEEEGREEDQELFNVEKMKVSKIYHSSSEEEHLEKPVETKKVLKKKAAKEDKNSAEFKAKMTERFLKKQKLAEEEKALQEAFKNGEKRTKKKDGAYYSDSDEESDDEVKKSHEVLEKLQSFAGDLWKDSDDEGETRRRISALKENDDEESSEDEEDEDEDSSNEEEEEEKVVRKKPMFDPSPMIRYDPLSEGQENYLRGETADGDTGLENEVEKEEEKPTSSFSVTSDLKAAFNSSKGFSFGFGGSKEATNEKEKPKEVEAKGDWDAEEEADESIAVDVVKKSNDDVAASFGRQLRVKGVDKAASPFFFTPNDPRLETGLDFFFNQEVDMDKLREDWDSKGRAVLVEILKKRARSKAAKAKAASGKRKGQQGQGWRRGGKKKQRL